MLEHVQVHRRRQGTTDDALPFARSPTSIFHHNWNHATGAFLVYSIIKFKTAEIPVFSKIHLLDIIICNEYYDDSAAINAVCDGFSYLTFHPLRIKPCDKSGTLQFIINAKYEVMIVVSILIFVPVMRQKRCLEFDVRVYEKQTLYIYIYIYIYIFVMT